jgi:thioredoxin reductase (NADPH)
VTPGRRPTRSPANLPVLFVVDHDRTSLDALLSHLSRRFGNDFMVRGETSPAAAIGVLRELAAADEAVAVLLVDDAVSDVLACAHVLHPSAKRVLLVDRDYSSASPAVQAITLGRAEYHIVRPWTDEESANRAMGEFLSSWIREQTPSFEEFRIVAAKGDVRALQLRDVMTRFSMPFGFYAVDSEAGRRLLAEAGVDASRLPVVIRYDGKVTIDPDLPDLARAIGVSVKNHIDTCEVAIVGAGPAGLTAAVYAASEGLETVLLEREVSGGQAGTSPLIRNYPGRLASGVRPRGRQREPRHAGSGRVHRRRGQLRWTGGVASRQARSRRHAARSRPQPREVDVELPRTSH